MSRHHVTRFWLRVVARILVMLLSEGWRVARRRPAEIGLVLKEGVAHQRWKVWFVLCQVNRRLLRQNTLRIKSVLVCIDKTWTSQSASTKEAYWWRNILRSFGRSEILRKQQVQFVGLVNAQISNRFDWRGSLCVKLGLPLTLLLSLDVHAGRHLAGHVHALLSLPLSANWSRDVKLEVQVFPDSLKPSPLFTHELFLAFNLLNLFIHSSLLLLLLVKQIPFPLLHFIKLLTNGCFHHG